MEAKKVDKDIIDDNLDTDTDPIYTINVGGTIFKERKSILIKSGYFEAMFNFHKTETDFSKEHISRDPIIFSYLLNCMRDNNYINNSIIKYNPDVIFFQINHLQEMIEKYEKEENKSDIKIELIDKNAQVTKYNNGLFGLFMHKKTRLFVRWKEQIEGITTGINLYIPEGYVGLLNFANDGDPFGYFKIWNSILHHGKYDNFKVWVMFGNDYGDRKIYYDGSKPFCHLHIIKLNESIVGISKSIDFEKNNSVADEDTANYNKCKVYY